jgi:hypothetical protein
MRVVAPSAFTLPGEFTMLKSIAAKSIMVIASASLVAGLAVFLASFVPEAHAAVQGDAPVAQPHAKGDRLPNLAKGAECSSRGWPYYEQRCQFDLRRSADETPVVRMIVLR